MKAALNTFREAGLRPKHLAPIIGVSRVTASIWLNGHGEPHVLLRKKVDALEALVRKAIQARKLPIPADVSKSEEVEYLRVTLQQMKA